VEVVILPSARDVGLAAARIVACLIRSRPACVLGLATGATPRPVYAELVRMHREEGLSFAGVTTFNLDELVGLGPAHPASYRRYMEEELFRRVDLAPARARVPDGAAADLARECADYEAAIRAAGGIDLQLLGIGVAGHIGFNEPLSAIRSRTRDKTLTETTRLQNAEMFGGDPDAVPRRALTMGVGTILEARELILLASGAAKAEIVARAVEGPITASVSASAIQLHGNCKVVVDADAAVALTGRDYYDFVFASEPEWAAYRD
jgi:glucosamine-6-phosphate deaminase